MYKILFVDDERSVLEYLPFAIDWKELGITQMYTAASAKEALCIVKKEMPDIAWMWRCQRWMVWSFAGRRRRYIRRLNL